MPAQRRLRLAAGLTTLLLLAGCGLFGDDGPEPRRNRYDAGYRMQPDCPVAGPPLPSSAGLINDLVTRTRSRWFVAGDIGASAMLSDGRIAWVFGDTLRSAGVSPRLVANSMLLSSRACLSIALPADRGPVIPDREGAVHWPMSIARLDPPAYLPDTITDVLVVMCSRIDRGDDGPFGFTYLGSSAAVFVVPRDGAPQFVRMLELTEDDTDLHQVNWGAAAMVHEGWLYVYGTRLTEDEHVYGRELYVARAPTSDPETRSRWRFWDGASWQTDRATAVPVLPAAGGVSQTLSVDHTDAGFVAVSKRGGDVADFVYTWTAPSPVGPWTARRGIRAPFGVDQDRLQYAPLAHPEIPLASGRLLVSVSRNTSDLDLLQRRPVVGRPLFAEVEVPNLTRR